MIQRLCQNVLVEIPVDGKNVKILEKLYQRCLSYSSAEHVTKTIILKILSPKFDSSSFLKLSDTSIQGKLTGMLGIGRIVKI